MWEFLLDTVCGTLAAFVLGVLLIVPVALVARNDNRWYFWLYCVSIGIMFALFKSAEREEQNR